MWRCLDESSVELVDVYIDGQFIKGFIPNLASADGKVSYQIHENLDAMQLELHVSDHFGNKAVEVFQFPLIQNTPPAISIRNPPAGSRLIEGEAFTLNCLPSDNSQTTSVSVYVKTGSDQQLIKTFETSEMNASETEFLMLQIKVIAMDGAGNTGEKTCPVRLIRNSPPEIRHIQVLNSRGFKLSDALETITEGRNIIVNVLAVDREKGIDNITLYQAIHASNMTPEYQKIGIDESAPYQFHITIPKDHVGEIIRFQASAKDIDGYSNDASTIRSLMISKDQPPQASIVSPENDSSVIIEGQDIHIVVKALDDLGYSGIEKVVFYINNVPLKTAWQSMSETDSHLYQAVFSPPQGLKGFVVHAVAYDILGHFTKTQSVYIGTIEDTVAPRLSILYPIDGDILTASESIRPVVSVEDIGIESDRKVLLTFIREYRNSEQSTLLSLTPRSFRKREKCSKKYLLYRHSSISKHKPDRCIDCRMVHSGSHGNGTWPGQFDSSR